MSPAAKDVWVFVDHMDGRPMRVSLELLAEARRIADETSGRVDAIVFGLDEAAPLAQLAQHGADRICLFESATVSPVLELLQPQIHAKGADYTVESVPEREVVAAYGGRTAICGDPKDHATTDLIGIILERFGRDRA